MHIPGLLCHLFFPTGFLGRTGFACGGEGHGDGLGSGMPALYLARDIIGDGFLITTFFEGHDFWVPGFLRVRFFIVAQARWQGGGVKLRGVVGFSIMRNYTKYI